MNTYRTHNSDIIEIRTVDPDSGEWLDSWIRYDREEAEAEAEEARARGLRVEVFDLTDSETLARLERKTPGYYLFFRPDLED